MRKFVKVTFFEDDKWGKTWQEEKLILVMFEVLSSEIMEVRKLRRSRSQDELYTGGGEQAMEDTNTCQRESWWPQKKRTKAIRFSNNNNDDCNLSAECQLKCAWWVSHCAFGRKCRIIVWLFELPPLYKTLEWVATYKRHNLKCMLFVAFFWQQDQSKQLLWS